MKMKKCSKCKKEFPATAKYFSTNNGTKDKFYAYCRKCHSQHNMKMLNNSPERLKKRSEWTSSIEGKFSFLRGRAKRKNFEFTLTKIDFAHLISTPCVYCGELQENFNGVDRINSNKGYTKDNCVSCCKLCNYMKNKYSEEIFKKHVDKIYKYQYELRSATP